MTNQFDASILFLTVMERKLRPIKGDDTVRHCFTMSEEDYPAIKNGLRVLEAAGKVDKHHVADATDKWFKWTPEMAELIDAIPGENHPSERAALPDEEKP